MCSTVRQECACAEHVHTVVACWYFPPRLIASFDLPRLYNFFSLSHIFIENENKWEFFISEDWSGRDKFAILSIFFRRYRSTEITRIKIILQIVDGEIGRCWDPSAGVQTRRTENNETRKVKMFCFQADESAEILLSVVARLSFDIQTNNSRAMIYFRLEHQLLILQIALRLISTAKIIICLQYIIMRVVWFSVDIIRKGTRSGRSK